MRAALAVVLFGGLITSCTTESPPQTSAVSQPSRSAISISDTNAVPFIDTTGVIGYSRFLRSDLHRAFAVSEDGAWGYAIERETQDGAIKSALIICQDYSTAPCSLYAVDACIVWRDSRCSPGDIQKAESADRAGDYRTAFAEYMALAKTGNGRAALYVAESYASGRGVVVSTAGMYEWYVKAGDNGEPYGWYKAGMLRTRNGQPFYDPAKGRQFVVMAAERGNAEAQFRLGEWYRLGVDSPVDMNVALNWHRSAAAQGFQASQDALKKYFGES